MKWFKHQCDLCRDEGVSIYLEQAGKDSLAAYGFFARILEVLGEKMSPKKGDRLCSAEYSVKGWAKVLDCHVNRVKKYMDMLPHIPWVSVEFDGSNYRVSVPRMWEWRDEYARKPGVYPDKVAQRRTDQIRKDERETKEGALSDGKSSGSRTPPKDFKITEDMRKWAEREYPNVDIESETTKFRRHEYTSPRSDWDAAWKTWIQRNSEYKVNQQSASGVPSKTEQLRRLGNDLGLKRKECETEADYLRRVTEANDNRISRLDS